MTDLKSGKATWPLKLARLFGLLLAFGGALTAIFVGVCFIDYCNDLLKYYDFITSVFIFRMLFYLIPVAGVVGIIGWWLQRGDGKLVLVGSVLLIVETVVLLIVPLALSIVADDFLGAGTSRQMQLETIGLVLAIPAACALIAGGIGFYRLHIERKKA